MSLEITEAFTDQTSTATVPEPEKNSPVASKTEKQQTWDAMTEQLISTVDGLGLEIDTGILETVVAFNVLGFYTSASCEGHLDHGVASPWVDIGIRQENEELVDEAEEARELADSIWQQFQANGQITPEQEDQMNKLWDKARELNKEIEHPYLVEREKVMALLAEFYQERYVLYDIQLTMQFIGRRTRIQCQGAEILELKPIEVQQIKLLAYQAEMREFTVFLKQKCMN